MLEMYFLVLMGTFVIGIAVMLAIMGARQWKLGYRLAGGLSLLVAIAIMMSGIVGLMYWITS